MSPNRSLKIKHPYIMDNPKIRSGAPFIDGTGITVLDIAIRHEVMQMSPEEIILALPHLTLPQVYDALSYYYENKEELDWEWKVSLKKVARMKKARSSILEEKLGQVKDLYR